MAECRDCLNRCCFIDQECMSKITPITANADPDNVMIAIELAQEDIKGLLVNCYKELCQRIIDEDVTGEWLVLLEEIKKPLAWMAFKHWLDLFGKFEYSSSVKVMGQILGQEGASSNDISGLIVSVSKIINSRVSAFKENIEDLTLACLKKDCACEIPPPCDDKGVEPFDNAFSISVV